MSEPQAISENQRGEVLATDYVRSLSTGGGKPGAGYPAVMVPRSIAFRGRGDGMGEPELGEPNQVNSLRSTHGGAADMVFAPLAFHATQDPITDADAPNFGASASVGIQYGLTVRRLTPLERERLMGWADGWTEWGLDEAGQRVDMADTTRDRMTGNGVVSPVAAWIAARIRKADGRSP